MAQIFERIEKRCFVGHTHVPGVFTDEPDFYPPQDLGGTYNFVDSEKCIINPGSVGQPRDRIPLASYAVLHDDHVEFVRLKYDIQAVIAKVKAEKDLSDFRNSSRANASSAARRVFVSVDPDSRNGRQCASSAGNSTDHRSPRR